jgi:hypothetical protein
MVFLFPHSLERKSAAMRGEKTLSQKTSPRFNVILSMRRLVEIFLMDDTKQHRPFVASSYLLPHLMIFAL